MKVERILLPILLAWATFAVAANNLPNVQHVIIIIQENRTTDNLFNEDSALMAAGGHVRSLNNQGLSKCSSNGLTLLQPTSLYTCWDPDHSHGPYASGKGAWEAMWDDGNMDGACSINITDSNCGADTPACFSAASCSYAYVDNAVWNGSAPYDRILNPYFQIASQFGFANFMFQTNQGPSFPAHQFLLSGTSAPEAYNSDSCGSYPCYQWFAAENYASSGGWGCASTTSNIWEVDPSITSPDNESQGIYNNGIPCYKHPTLVDLLDNAQPKITWKYYAQSVTPGDDLWTAPNASENICQPSNGRSGPCSTMGEWKTNVADVTPYSGSYDAAPILDDIENCNLPNVSWVIPDGYWSDHANKGPYGDGGPSWVAALVNAIGVSPSACEGGDGYWSDTVILVTWDDWGGWYDDVVPPNCGPGQSCGYFGGGSNPTNGQQYVYGFRVPLLVIGAYAKPGYISGGNVSLPPDCLHNTYCHDFGSILNFIEYAFGLPQGGIGDSHWPYADHFVMDVQPFPPNNYSLYDFFDFTTFNQFQQINGAKYPEYCFHKPNQTGCFPGTYPMDPDNDANEGD
jgi:phospholipase C